MYRLEEFKESNCEIGKKGKYHDLDDWDRIILADKYNINQNLSISHTGNQDFLGGLTNKGYKLYNLIESNGLEYLPVKKNRNFHVLSPNGETTRLYTREEDSPFESQELDIQKTIGNIRGK